MKGDESDSQRNEEEGPIEQTEEDVQMSQIIEDGDEKQKDQDSSSHVASEITMAKEMIERGQED